MKVVDKYGHIMENAEELNDSELLIEKFKITVYADSVCEPTPGKYETHRITCGEHISEIFPSDEQITWCLKHFNGQWAEVTRVYQFDFVPFA